MNNKSTPNKEKRKRRRRRNIHTRVQDPRLFEMGVIENRVPMGSPKIQWCIINFPIQPAILGYVYHCSGQPYTMHCCVRRSMIFHDPQVVPNEGVSSPSVELSCWLNQLLLRDPFEVAQ
jgi:hypothetical protein